MIPRSSGLISRYRVGVLVMMSMLPSLVIPTSAKSVDSHSAEPELEEWELISEEERLMYIGGSLVLVVLAGLFSGMTVGLLSMDPIELKIRLMNSTTAEERGKIHRVLGLVQRHHLLLVTLLLGNAICMETLPLFLDRIMPSFWAILVSVTAVLFFGEILPQAFCTGKHQMTIAAYLAPAVWFFIFFFFPIGYPLGKLLDAWLGHDETDYYDKDHLKNIIRVHGDQRAQGSRAGSSRGVAGELLRDEVNVIEGALDLGRKRVDQVMVPWENVYALEIDSLLTRDLLTEIVFSGHSRIPVYEGSRHNVKGLLLVKQLVLLDPNEGAPVRDFVMANPLVAHPEASLYDLLNEFQVGRSHFALVTEYVEEYTDALDERREVREGAQCLGIVTLEDVIEELIQEEILDEFDCGTNNDMLLQANRPRTERGAVRRMAGGGSFVGQTPTLLPQSASLMAAPGPLGLGAPYHQAAVVRRQTDEYMTGSPALNAQTSPLHGTVRPPTATVQQTSPSFLDGSTDGGVSATPFLPPPAVGPAIGAPTRWGAADPELLKDGGKTIAAQVVLQKIAAPVASAAAVGGAVAAVEAVRQIEEPRGRQIAFSTVPPAAAPASAHGSVSSHRAGLLSIDASTANAPLMPVTHSQSVRATSTGMQSRRVLGNLRGRAHTTTVSGDAVADLYAQEAAINGAYTAVVDQDGSNPLLTAIGGGATYTPLNARPGRESPSMTALAAPSPAVVSGTYTSQQAPLNQLYLTTAALNAAVQQQQQRASEGGGPSSRPSIDAGTPRHSQAAIHVSTLPHHHAGDMLLFDDHAPNMPLGEVPEAPTQEEAGGDVQDESEASPVKEADSPDGAVKTEAGNKGGKKKGGKRR